MPATLLILLWLTAHVFAKKPPDVDCVVMNLEYIHCFWNKQETPEVNYTLVSRYGNENMERKCTDYVYENNKTVGCNLYFEHEINKFKTIYNQLRPGGKETPLLLKERVKLNPPTNVTLKMEDDGNLVCRWSQISAGCVQSEIQYSLNDRMMEPEPVSVGKQNYYINLPSSRTQYTIRVRSKFADKCGMSKIWSEWSEPAVWGFNNSTDTNPFINSMSVWTPVMYVVGALTLIVMAMMLLHHERFRIILMPVVPKPIISHEKDWLQQSKGMKESFNPNYNELACPVREYLTISEYDSESSCGSTSTAITTDQTECSVLMPADEADLSTPCSSSTSTVAVSSEEIGQVSV